MYLVVWGAAYLKRRRDIGEGCGSLITPGGDSGGSPHLKHIETHGTYNDGRSIGRGESTTNNTKTHWTRARVQITETQSTQKIDFVHSEQ